MSIKNSSTPTKKYKYILSAVHMVYRLVNSTYNIRELSLRLTRLLCQFIKADSSSICILDTKKNEVVLKALFNNKINILLDKKKDLLHFSGKEKRVLSGFTVFEDHLIGLPLVGDDILGAVFIKRTKKENAFTGFDKEVLSVVTEQSVTAIKNLQLYEAQQKVILGSIEFIGKLIARQDHFSRISHTPVYFRVVKALAEKLGMRGEDLDNLYYASILRDAGAIDVPYNILAKTSQLTPEEFKEIRSQPKKSAELIQPVDFLKPVLPIILYRHEKYDGSGYPSGLKKDQIPLGAAIMAVVDAFEAMVRDRSYRTPLTVVQAIKDLRSNAGTQFDPKVINVFIELSKQKKFRKNLSLTRKQSNE